MSDSDAAALAALMAPQEALPEEETDTAAPGAQPPGCDVLIADDSGASRELLSAILRNFAGPLDIREARNGQEAVTLWQQWRPRITLLDIDMPGVDGLAALQHIRAARADAFVAMVSGGSSVDNVRKALALGTGGYVIKPYKPQRILDLLMRYRELSGHDLLG